MTTARCRLPPLWWTLLALMALPFAAAAHRLDEYLQATLVAIEPGDIRLQINLTPGVDMAGQVLDLIDRNHDSVISTDEAAAYAGLLKRDLNVRLDGRRAELKLVASNVFNADELRAGWGIIQLEFSAQPSLLAAGAHRLAVENRHLPATSVYLFNAALPRSDLVRIGAQKRNENQSVNEIEFTVFPAKRAFGAFEIGALLAALTVATLTAIWLARKGAAPHA